MDYGMIAGFTRSRKSSLVISRKRFIFWRMIELAHSCSTRPNAYWAFIVWTPNLRYTSTHLCIEDLTEKGFVFG